MKIFKVNENLIFNKMKKFFLNKTDNSLYIVYKEQALFHTFFLRIKIMIDTNFGFIRLTAK
jgi:hypothetical protein